MVVSFPPSFLGGQERESKEGKNEEDDRKCCKKKGGGGWVLRAYNYLKKGNCKVSIKAFQDESHNRI